jgi:hypothetical protein
MKKVKEGAGSLCADRSLMWVNASSNDVPHQSRRKWFKALLPGLGMESQQDLYLLSGPLSRIIHHTSISVLTSSKDMD